MIFSISRLKFKAEIQAIMSTEETSIALNSSEAAYTATNDTSVIFPHPSQYLLAWEDVKEGLLKWRVWLMLAYQDIKLRYRRSVLGPFWLTLSMAITVYSMGFLYARLFQTELTLYYPFLVSGMLAWSLLSSIVLEVTDGFMVSESLIKQIKLPYTVYIHRLASRNVMIFFHNILVMIPIIIIFHESVKINFYTLLLIPGLAITYFNAITYGTLLAMLGARYRDISQAIKSLVQVIFFITPVMWKPGILSEKSQWVVNFNPFYGFIECLRRPLLGDIPTFNNLISIVLVTVVGLLISSKIFIRYRPRIVYWL